MASRTRGRPFTLNALRRCMKSLNAIMSFQAQIQTQDVMLSGQETEATTERWAAFPMSALKDLRSLRADPL